MAISALNQLAGDDTSKYPQSLASPADKHRDNPVEVLLWPKSTDLLYAGGFYFYAGGILPYTGWFLSYTVADFSPTLLIFSPMLYISLLH